MKYLLIIYGTQESWDAIPPDERDAMIAKFDAFNTKHMKSGELLGAYGLAPESEAKTVRVRDGMPVVTDGPYLEAKEYLASTYLLDVADEARALEIAAELPAAALSQVEFWPILHEASP
ncbi:hypothetical protein Aph01nite_28040 [Acrocarpospora phusangensis]|uniref:YCII-related domain-containing protein n=1 Tax=Acrocarpospora phusangensis TaxID=1070424 RepID=A0A919Q8L2_9ACTN|nr:YciI family protein [Acrocarpospora phusangensis]GIH24494.1 hypothetical protein Aph01nite_28040 [Acrocarpospora phusangensis]